MENPEVESDFLRSVHALLRELDGHHPAFQSERGMLRWTLHKKIDRNPSNGSLLIRILVKELERAERCNYRQYIIPLLHTLMYTLIKAPFIPDSLYERVYDFCKKLLTLPKPYCTIGLDYARQLKLERTIPGILYQQMVSAEQCLKNDSFPYQEKVFMFADPDLLSVAVCRAFIDEIKAAQTFQCARSCMLYVIERAFQSVLKEQYDVRDLHSLLQAKPLDVIEHCFQQVMAAIEHAGRAMNAGYSKYVEEVRKIYNTLLSTSEEDVQKDEAERSPGIPLPNPRISFHIWRDEDQLWKELVLFLRSPSQSCEQDSLSPELDSFEFQDLVPDFDCCEQTRFSVLSNDSGIERDLPMPGDEIPSFCTTEAEHSRLQRKGCIKKKGASVDSIPFLQSGCSGQGVKPTGKLHRKSGGSTMEPMAVMKRLHTARVLVLGDDRVLGRLAQAYYSLRKRESRRAFLTRRLKVEFYYVPVVEEQPISSPAEEYALPDQTEPCELAAYLGRVDPWYESNINTLCHMIPKLATMPSSPSKTAASDLFIIDVIAYYVRLGLQPVFFQVYAVKLHFSNVTLEPIEDIFIIELNITLDDFNPSTDNLPVKKKPATEVPGTDLTLLYKKVLLSNREKDETVSVRSTGLVMKAIPSNEIEDLVCLSVNIAEVVKTSNLSGRSYAMVTNTIRTRNIALRSAEQRSFTVCLDKDSRRVYKNVISIEVFPCLEPSYCLQKTKAKQATLEEEEDVGLAKYLPKSLLLPINTFAGIIQ
ncbi:phosphoinositide 3-kinase regulatory subunit 6 isoform X1 [Sceloporus undulatus]|uniref:phosphoinositide 3-kinase regulatory subunit 6 isoform X1 n=2 Tax=Sceloporus undulatus TaxID=8520 RepID=UPI001C4AF803|nr:phosphoinositide 3-kinase regulatory subunit 6 isoform X1 [Sceloporus undulatus]XP_042309866.1 phosphoinositide 3-kinase regulatory subunit 6 isoform X1 [Sceloporus undulatus]XP_042309869.1 phosphoinositide 3-kinase regulatory subunit 6 isoform X1 [Sceloporus undulatus]XP_042309870.1 phosphoinositide 3-kinase regulatory subunit 6 isoform X1 [Sceloporus undulatus]